MDLELLQQIIFVIQEVLLQLVMLLEDQDTQEQVDLESIKRIEEVGSIQWVLEPTERACIYLRMVHLLLIFQLSTIQMQLKAILHLQEMEVGTQTDLKVILLQLEMEVGTTLDTHLLLGMEVGTQVVVVEEEVEDFEESSRSERER